ncbi:hypothetical protein PQX77_021846 [Marasmius sp. AFHP31]|nr:hypothetical protein PQX77_021846 [Marasmius sp. AFHP31]
MGSTNAIAKRRKSSRQSRPSLKSNKGENGTGNLHDDSSPPGSDVVKKEEAASFSDSPEEDHGWNHPAELDYFMPHSWNDTQIIHHLIAYSFDIPAKIGPFCHIIGANGVKTVLPGGYRIPLMFLARFQWLSLQLVLMAEDRETEWEEYKFGILHVSRLCKKLLDSAQDALQTRFKYGVDRKWRCPTFDRALVRYKLKWFISKPEEVQSFWEEYGEGEYKDDIVTFAWRGWALKGHHGFSLTLDEIENGITAQQLMQGLKERDGRWYWEVEGSPEEGADAWSLRHAALAAMSPLTVPSLPPKITSCTPLTTAKLSNTPPVPPSTRPYNIPTDQASISPNNNAESQQAPSLPRSNSSVEAEPRSERPHTDMIRIPQSARVEIPAGNEDTTLAAMQRSTSTTGGSLSGVGNVQTERPGKRPGSPLEKETSPKPRRTAKPRRTVKPRRTANDHLPDPEAPPYSPTSLAVPTPREPDVGAPEPTPSHLENLTNPIRPQGDDQRDLHTSGNGTSLSESSQPKFISGQAARPSSVNRNVQIVAASDSSSPNISDDHMAVDSITDANSSQTPTPTRQPKTVALPPLTRSLSTPAALTSKTIYRISRSASTGSNAFPQTSSHNHSSPPPVQATEEYIRTLQQQWQRSRSKSSSEGIAFPSFPAPSTAASTNPRSILRPTLTNADNNARLIDSLMVMFTHEMKKISDEIGQAKEDIVKEFRDQVREIVRAEVREGLAEILQQSGGEGSTGTNRNPVRDDDQIVATVRATIKEGLAGLKSVVDDIVRTSVSEAVGSLTEGVFEVRKLAEESQRRQKELNIAFTQMRAELDALRNGEGVGGGARSVVETTTSNDVNVESAVAPLSLSSHPLGHLLEEPESDEDTDLLGHATVLESFGPGMRTRSYSGTPMSMSPDIILLDQETLERKSVVEDDIPSSVPRSTSPILNDEVIDVKPVMIDGEPCIPDLDGGQPTPLTAFSCPIPARSHRKFKKLGISSSGESISSASFFRENRSAV